MNKIYISALLLILGLAPSCSSLTEEPYGMIVPEEFYRNELDAKVAVIAAYNALNSPSYYNGSMYLLSDIVSDDAYPGSSSKQDANVFALDNYTFDPSHDEFRKVWLACYTGINRANVIIERVPAISMDTVIRKSLVGEAHFLRALHYFNLVRWFGKVPLVLHSTKDVNDLKVARNSVEEVYAQIIRDLEIAEKSLPARYSYAGIEVGKATSGAATSLLAKVYLTQENWEMAAKKAKQVMDSKMYKLYPEYVFLWHTGYVGLLEGPSYNWYEHIFSVQQGATSYIQAFAPENLAININGRGGLSLPEQEFYNSFSDLDVRKTIAFATDYTLADGTSKSYTPHIAKYYNPSTNNAARSGFTYPNMPVIRYAEILLIYAEALNEIDPGNPLAYYALNDVRTRAKLSDLNNLSQDEFRKAVWQERRWELCFEGHRWFDLVRTKQLVTVMKAQGKANVKNANVLFPVPQHEISLNPAIAPQNDGY